jgi:tetratricopeptide (TPR) repeat protein
MSLPSRDGRIPHLITILVLSVFCILLYHHVLDFPFVLDDVRHIQDNPYIRITSLHWANLRDAAFEGLSSYRPIPMVTFALNYFLGGYDPAGYHVVNIVIHLVNGILVYFLALVLFRQLLDRGGGKGATPPDAPVPPSLKASIQEMSLFAALLFVVHPLQTQSVTYIIQRMNSMAVLFCLSALLLYIHGRFARTTWKRWTLFAACVVSWGLALGSKQIAAPLPFFLFLYEWYFFQDLSMAWIKRNIGYALVPVAVFCLVALVYLAPNPLEKIAGRYEYRDFSMWERVLSEFRVVVYYVSLFLFPHPSRLRVDYDVPPSQGWLDPMTTLFSLGAILGLMGLAVCLAKKERLASFTILWYFGSLVVESSIIPLALVFEHRVYLPSVLLCMMMVSLIYRLVTRWPRVRLVLLCAMVAVLCLWTYQRNQVWKDPITLWEDCVKKSPNGARAHFHLGTALIVHPEHYDTAVFHFCEALRLDPHYPDAHVSLGIALMEKDKLDEAISHFHTALKIMPIFPRAHLHLGRALSRQGRLEEAAGHLAQALQMRSDFVDAYNDLGNVLVRLGHHDDAADMYSEVLRREPDNVKAHCNLAIVLLGQERLDKAISHFSKALEITPDNAQVHSNLGVALVRQGRLEEAVHHFSEALRLNPDDANARNNLAFARQWLEKAKGPSAPPPKP